MPVAYITGGGVASPVTIQIAEPAAMPQVPPASMEAPEIRPITPADLDEAARLLAVMNHETPPHVVRERLDTVLRDHAHYELVGAWTGGTLAGVAGAWVATKIWCGHHLEIDNIVVDPEARSSGIGTALVDHLVKRAEQRGCKLVTLDSYVSNHASHRLYHRLGFEIWGFHFVKPIGDWKGDGSA